MCRISVRPRQHACGVKAQLRRYIPTGEGDLSRELQDLQHGSATDLKTSGIGQATSFPTEAPTGENSGWGDDRLKKKMAQGSTLPSHSSQVPSRRCTLAGWEWGLHELRPGPDQSQASRASILDYLSMCERESRATLDEKRERMAGRAMVRAAEARGDGPSSRRDLPLFMLL
jgi:hypothetical protein